MSPPEFPSTVNCPICSKVVAWVTENRYRPFCSKRCKAIDLGAWAAEDYRVAEQPPSPDSAGQS